MGTLTPAAGDDLGGVIDEGLVGKPRAVRAPEIPEVGPGVPLGAVDEPLLGQAAEVFALAADVVVVLRVLGQTGQAGVQRD